MTANKAGAFWPVVIRGTLGRCPSCGKGRIFRRYLKPVERCGTCNEKLGHIRADDGPAWFTILLVAHLLAPFFLHVLPQVNRPDWQIMIAVMATILALSLAILPRAKGAFIGLIWRSGCVGSEE